MNNCKCGEVKEDWKDACSKCYSEARYGKRMERSVTVDEKTDLEESGDLETYGEDHEYDLFEIMNRDLEVFVCDSCGCMDESCNCEERHDMLGADYHD